MSLLSALSLASSLANIAGTRPKKRCINPRPYGTATKLRAKRKAERRRKAGHYI